MHTPRRILLSFLGIAVALLGYVAYTQALGRVDGLPQLPEKFARIADHTNLPRIEWNKRTQVGWNHR